MFIGNVSSAISLDVMLQTILRDKNYTYDEFQLMHGLSVRHSNKFWKELAQSNLVFKPPTPVGTIWNDQAFSNGHGTDRDALQFMPDVRINACYNLLDRNVDRGLGDKPALY